jgi:hypothetical protein
MQGQKKEKKKEKMKKNITWAIWPIFCQPISWPIHFLTLPPLSIPKGSRHFSWSALCCAHQLLALLCAAPTRPLL